MPRVQITIPEQNAQPYRFQLERKIVSIGRGSDNDIVIESASVSGKHAEMQRVDGGYILTDVGSTNGIKNDGVKEQKISLVPGMSVKLGDVAFDFSLSEEEIEILGREKPIDEIPSAHPPLPDLPADDIEDEPSPKREPERKYQRKVVVPDSATSGSGFGMVFLFILLAAGAFYAGLSIRHQKETGESLLKAIVNKDQEQQEQPVEEGPPAEKTAE